MSSEVPFVIRAANVKVLIVLAPGRDGVDIWSAKARELATKARDGYIGVDLHEPLVWKLYLPGSCQMCEQTCATVLWMGPRKDKPREIPKPKGVQISLLDCPPHFNMAREGPRDSRFLLCGACYSVWGGRLMCATVPPQTRISTQECRCCWTGTCLLACNHHQTAVIHAGLALNRGPGDLLEGGAPDRRMRRSGEAIVFRGSTEDLRALTKSELECMIDNHFPNFPSSRPSRRAYEKGPEWLSLGPCDERDKVMSNCTLKSKGAMLDFPLSSIFKMMLGAREQLRVDEIDPNPFSMGHVVSDEWDWLTTCSTHKRRDIRREVLEWTVPCKEVKFLTREEVTKEGAARKPCSVKELAWIKFRISMDVSIMGAIVTAHFTCLTTEAPLKKRKGWFRWPSRMEGSDRAPSNKKTVSWLHLKKE